jgi:succinate dehydrogenase/fumarate reductase-like Fe-S protein
MSVHDCLNYIRENLDPSLAYFINCQLGFCLRCNLRVNGKVVPACETRAEGDLTLEPVNADEVIRDLWCEST